MFHDFRLQATVTAARSSSRFVWHRFSKPRDSMHEASRLTISGTARGYVKHCVRIDLMHLHGFFRPVLVAILNDTERVNLLSLIHKKDINGLMDKPYPEESHCVGSVQLASHF
jgi:hypothetical protein